MHNREEAGRGAGEPVALWRRRPPAGDVEPGAMLTTRFSPKSPVTESYRVLRTNLQFLGLDKPLRSVVIASSVPNEGKSLTTANLGIAVAQAGSRVILVDADLRKPSLHRFFDLGHEVGLTTVLAGEATPEEALQDTHVPNLRFLASGPVPPNPAELLGSPRMAAAAEQLGAACDMIIYDTPPVEAVTDAAVLSTLADGVVLVVRSGAAAYNLAQRAKEALEKVKARVLGVVLDDVPPNGEGAYYYQYHGYYGRGY